MLSTSWSSHSESLLVRIMDIWLERPTVAVEWPIAPKEVGIAIDIYIKKKDFSCLRCVTRRCSGSSLEVGLGRERVSAGGAASHSQTTRAIWRMAVHMLHASMKRN